MRIRAFEPMQRAFDLAQQGAALGEVPVGAVIVDADGSLLAEAHNQTEAAYDPAGHAEIIALRQAGQVLQSPRLIDCDMYVTLEPCPMCASAISQARIRRLYYGAYDPKSGGIDHGPKIYQSAGCHHIPEVFGGIREAEAQKLLQEFFKQRR